MPRLSARSVLLPDGSLVPAELVFDGDLITEVRPASAGVRDGIIAAGFVDIQVNGHDALDVAAMSGSDWEKMDEILLAQGVTCWCPTLVSAPLPSYREPLARIAQAASRGGARPAIAGAHLEGPFLGGLTGAHDPACVVAPDLGWVEELPDVVRIMTIGPEVSGALGLARALRTRGIVAGLGHSAATYEEAVAAADAGARLVTHLFNAMAPLHHRQPGLVGAALTDPRLTPSVIADGIHVHPSILLATFRARAALMGQGHPGVVLVTDAVAWRSAAMAGSPLIRQAGDAPRRPDGTLAGSALRMPEAVAGAVEAGVPLGSALAAASRAPSELLGLEGRGRLLPGARADLVVLGPDLSVRSTWVAGQEVWSA